LDLAPRGQRGDAVEELGVNRVKPLQQVARVMERRLHRRVRFQPLDDWPVAVLVELLQHPLEVADGLVVVKRQRQVQALHRRPNTDYPLPFMTGAGFEGVAGHRRVLRLLESQLQGDHLAHAYLFAGEPQLGKNAVARRFAASTLSAATTGRPPYYWAVVRMAATQ